MSVGNNPQATWPGIPSPHRSGMSAATRIGLILLGFMVIGTVVSVLVNDEGAERAGRVDRTDGTDTRTHEEPADPKDAMNTVERKLYNAVPFYRCVPLSGAVVPEGVEAAIRCNATIRHGSGDDREAGAQMRAIYYKYETAAGGQEAYSKRVDALNYSGTANVHSEAGWCETISYLQCFGSDGRVVFYSEGEHVFVEWTAPHRIYGKVERFDDRMGKLTTYWWDMRFNT